jgi:RNA polymerase sigma-70 factor (ECF subfamily)
LHATDSELVDRARLGEEAAFDEIVERYAKRLFSVAFSLLGNRSDAEDVVQETFLGAVAGIGKYEGRASLKTWLIRILVNQVSKVRRGRSLRMHQPLPADESEKLADNSGRAGSTATNVERKTDVSAMLMTLDDEFREVLVLRELEGLSYDQIATVLRIPRGTVESRLYRARKKIQERFEGYM